MLIFIIIFNHFLNSKSINLLILKYFTFHIFPLHTEPACRSGSLLNNEFIHLIYFYIIFLIIKYEHHVNKNNKY